jgi:hypothetical protein
MLPWKHQSDAHEASAISAPMTASMAGRIAARRPLKTLPGAGADGTLTPPFCPSSGAFLG